MRDEGVSVSGERVTYVYNYEGNSVRSEGVDVE